MKLNGLELIQCNSEVKNFDKVEDFQSDIENNFKEESFVVAYLDYEVMIGRWKDASFHFYNDKKIENKYIQKLRVFNENKEVLIWRTPAGFKGRLRTDYEGTKTMDVVVAYQVLFGTKKGENCNQDFTEITEDRGTSLILPFGKLKFDDNGNLISRIHIKTHNYVGYNDVNQATYVDCRFVCFTDGKDCLS